MPRKFNALKNVIMDIILKIFITKLNAILRLFDYFKNIKIAKILIRHNMIFKIYLCESVKL